MSDQLRILVVEDNPADADFIQEVLSATGSVSFHIESVARLAEAILRLAKHDMDLVLLDLGLPDSQGLATFHKLRQAMPDIPVIVLTGSDNDEMAVAAVRDGAQDYLVKGQIQGHLLIRAARYALARQQADNRERLARALLEVLNRPAGTQDAIHDILLLIKQSTGLEAVGIRLHEGDDFPYYETNGFPEDFVQVERYLCARDAAGQIERDQTGNPILECMCGNILCGRANPALPFFTADGSFWTNSTTDLLASTTAAERQALTRNRCHTEGYESVALIPLRAGDKIIGLLQLNDRRPNRFKPEMIRFFEGLGTSIGIALARQRAEQEIRQLNAELEQRVRRRTTALEAANKELETFSYSVSHDLRAPLRAIDGWAQALLEDFGATLGETGRELLQRQRAASQRMGMLIDDLLQLAHLTRQPLTRQTVVLAAMVARVWEELRSAQPLQTAELVVGALPDCQADPNLLTQVFVNLLGNALKFSSGHAQPRIEVGSQPGPGGECVYFVKDNGAGFDMRYVNKLFGAFQRLHSAQEFPGTGIGLAIVQRIIHRHGGHIWAEGEVGKGAAFYFTLKGEEK